MDIDPINKYYDLARIGNGLAVDHYANLAVKASVCTECEHCNEPWPFYAD